MAWDDYWADEEGVLELAFSPLEYSGDIDVENLEVSSEIREIDGHNQLVVTIAGGDEKQKYHRKIERGHAP